MTRIDLLTCQDSLPSVSSLGDLDPLRTRDALFESQLLAASVDALRGRASLLLEFRTAFHFPLEDNTAVLWASGVTEFVWSPQPRHTDRTAWNVDLSELATSDRGLTLRLGFFPSADLSLTARRLWFAVGSVSHLADIPDYGEVSEQQLRDNTAQWTSELDVRAASAWPSPAGVS